ncbi:hypothetical protein D3C71_2075450 [compost metagenome]
MGIMIHLGIHVAVVFPSRTVQPVRLQLHTPTLLRRVHPEAAGGDGTHLGIRSGGEPFSREGDGEYHGNPSFHLII